MLQISSKDALITSKRSIFCIFQIQNGSKLNVYVFLCMVLLAVRMVADVTETRNVIPKLV